MPINRRTALKNLLIISGGIVLLPSCVHHEGAASIPLKNISINGEQEKLLAEISDTIIPKTDTPGAKELFTHLFALTMVDDCFDPARQKEFVAGLNLFNTQFKNSYNKNFVDATSAERESFLNDIEHKKFPSKDLSSFYGSMKQLTIHGYMTSKYVGTNLVIYELVPGRFHGTFPIKTNQA